MLILYWDTMLQMLLLIDSLLNLQVESELFIFFLFLKYLLISIIFAGTNYYL